MPSLPGGVDTGWDITQWSAPGYFQPSEVNTNDTADADSLLGGVPIGEWEESVPGNTSKLAIYDSTKYGYTYALTQGGGSNADVFLQTKNKVAGVADTFDHQITFTANERITNVQSNNDTGAWFTYNAFQVFFNLNGKYTDVPAAGYFMQAVMADDRGQLATTSGGGTALSSGVYNLSNSYVYQDSSGTWHGDSAEVEDSLPLDGGTDQPFHQVTINLNASVDSLIARLARNDPTHASEYEDLSDWSLGGAYIGPEGASYGSTDPAYTATMEVNDIRITSSDEADVSYSPTAPAQKEVSVSAEDPSYVRVDPITPTTMSTIHLPSDGTSNVVLDSYSESPTGVLITVDAEGTNDIIHLNGYNATIDLSNVVGGVEIEGTGNESVKLTGTGAVYLSGSVGSVEDDRTDKGDYLSALPIISSGDQSSASGDGNNQTTPTSTSLNIASGSTETTSFSADTATVVSNGGSLNLTSANSLVMVGGYKNFNLSSVTGHTNIAAALSSSGSLNNVAGTPGITLEGAGANLTVSGGDVSVKGNGGGVLTKTGDGSASVFGEMSSMFLYGGTSNYVGATLDGIGHLSYSLGTIGLTLAGSASNMTVDGAGYDYFTAGAGSITLNNQASANITGVDSNGGNLYINANGGQINYQAETNVNATIVLGLGNAYLTYGEGYTATEVNMQASDMADVAGLKPANGELLATHLKSLSDVAVSYHDNNAYISESGGPGSIVLHNVHDGGVDLLGSLNGTNFSQQYQSNTLMIALNDKA
ncbi:hypothetical protein A0U91_14480 (plasmid) [Acetobacter persici]|uniref:Uncharacterized protein n=2 Tax=Acetobacter persici TaxID=1076596 RepID=A0A1U9LK00_9PROT|nr:hypothetical protein A0U91_14480 [Acetobacter persici]